jgi:DNA-directed RNA polymerase subunit L/DNA-directed RNA polymerase alpha subunit
MFRNYSFDPKDPSNCHTFEIHNVDLAIVNGIRRVILTDIPIPGVVGETINTEDPTVDILVNTGALHNEFITHRIGLIPICLKEDEIENFEDNSIVLELNVKNEGNKIENVTTNHIKATRNNVAITDKELQTIFPVNKVSNNHILITRLRTNEHLHFKAKVVKRMGRDNASFNPVSLCNFSYIQDPTEASKHQNVLDKERSYFKNKYGDPIAFKFDIEHINPNIAPKYLVNKSIEVMISKLNDLIAHLISKDESVRIQQFQDIENTFEFLIDNEDDTLGNIIQSYIHNKYIRDNEKFNNTTSCLYVGYLCPHPLKALMILRITLEDESNIQAFVSFLEANCKALTEELNKIKAEWNRFVIQNKVQ